MAKLFLINLNDQTICFSAKTEPVFSAVWHNQISHRPAPLGGAPPAVACPPYPLAIVVQTEVRTAKNGSKMERKNTEITTTFRFGCVCHACAMPWPVGR